MSQWQPQEYDPRQHQQRIAQHAPWDAQTSPYGQSGQMPFDQQQPQHQQPVPQIPQRRPARSAPPYPAHLVRFPSQALPRSRRKRGPSLGRIFYLGRHPVALLIEACITAIALEIIVAWAALVVMAWACWTAAVTAGWLWQVAAARMRR